MISDLSSITERFQAIAEQVLGAEDLDVDPWFYSYCGPVGNPRGAANYIRYHSDLLALAGVSGDSGVVIEAGCGFGFTLIAQVLLGARQVHGIELNPDMVSTIQAYLPLLPDDVSSRIEVLEGSAYEMPYEDTSADVLLSNEAISHYLDVDAFIDEAWRVLRPNGVLIIADQNNGSNPKIRREARQVWQAAECGPAGQTFGGHQLGAPYVEVRRALLDEHYPAVAEATRAELARRTAGFTEEQVLAAARTHIDGGPLPDSIYQPGQLAIAPNGMAMERLFSPPALARQLGRRGFRARAYGYWGGASGAPAIRAANKLLMALSPVTIFTAPSFRVVARKR